MIHSLDYFWGDFEIIPDGLALDLIEQVAASGRTNFLAPDQSLAHYDHEQWYLHV